MGVNIVPDVSRADGRLGLVGRDNNLVQIDQIDRHAALNVRAAGESGVATTLDGELALGDAEGQDGPRHLLGRDGGEAASGLRERLLLRPVSRLLELVSRTIGV